MQLRLTLNLQVGKGRRGSEEVFWALERRKSSVVDPTYVPPTSPAVSSSKKPKNRRIVDPTYRDTHILSSDDDVETPALMKKKKRKRPTDPSYRPIPESFESEVDAPRIKKQKLVGVKLQVPILAFSPSSNNSPSPSPSPVDEHPLRRRKGNLDLQEEYVEDSKNLALDVEEDEEEEIEQSCGRCLVM